MNLGVAVKELRTQRGMNQSDFAKKVGVSQTYLSQIEKGHKMPNMSVLENICIELRIPLPVAFWFTIEESDVSSEKKEHFRNIKPIIDQMIKSLW